MKYPNLYEYQIAKCSFWYALTIFNTYLIKKKSVNDLQMIAFVFTETLSSKLQYGGLFHGSMYTSMEWYLNKNIYHCLIWMFNEMKTKINAVKTQLQSLFNTLTKNSPNLYFNKQ